MSDAPRPRSDEVTDDEVRGERARAGWADSEERRNPVAPSEHVGEQPPEPESGRTRDPELDKRHS